MTLDAVRRGCGVDSDGGRANGEGGDVVQAALDDDLLLVDERTRLDAASGEPRVGDPLSPEPAASAGAPAARLVRASGSQVENELDRLAHQRVGHVVVHLGVSHGVGQYPALARADALLVDAYPRQHGLDRQRRRPRRQREPRQQRLLALEARPGRADPGRPRCGPRCACRSRPPRRAAGRRSWWPLPARGRRCGRS